MLKKYVAILLLTFATAILLGHNIVPHHHHHLDHEIAHHHHGHDNHEDEGSNDLGDLFSNVLHDSGSIISHNEITPTFAKKLISVVAILPDNLPTVSFTITPLIGKPPAQSHLYTASYSHATGLRGPPAPRA